MAFKIWPLTAEVTFIGDHNGDPRVSVVHYRHGSTQPTPGTGDMTALCQAVADNVLPAFRSAWSNTTRWTLVRAVYHGNNSRVEGSVALPVTAVGSRTGDPLPGDAQVVLAKQGSSAATWARGRINIGDIVEGDQVDNVINNAGEITNIVNAGAALLASQFTTSHSWRLVVASRKYSETSDVVSMTFNTLMKGLNTRRKGYKKHKRHATPT